MEASRVGIADFIQQPLSGPLRHTHCVHRYSIEYGVLWQQVAGGARHHRGFVPSRERCLRVRGITRPSARSPSTVVSIAGERLPGSPGNASRLDLMLTGRDCQRLCVKRWLVIVTSRPGRLSVDDVESSYEGAVVDLSPAALPSGKVTTVGAASKHALRALSCSWLVLDAEDRDRAAVLTELTANIAPQLVGARQLYVEGRGWERPSAAGAVPGRFPP
jgi:hypothetical protein